MPEESTEVIETHDEAPKGVTLEHLEQHKAAIRRDMEKIRDEMAEANRSEMSALRAELDEKKQELEQLKEWKAEVERRNEHEAAGKESDTTIVTPPAHLAPTAPSPTAPVDPEHAGQHEEPKRSGWKKAW